MVRAPCCEKIGLKKGPWSPEEDQLLSSYILTNGHANWRALPKQAGLKRCGKSCRLRWINYLSPEVKRGNFTKEEEDTIFQLHQMLGNRWSAIAARLPGRTDNEIKNVWHTHLKKKLPDYEPPKTTKRHPPPSGSLPAPNLHSETSMASSDVSSVTDSMATMEEDPNMFLQIDESFWTELPSFPTDEVQFDQSSVSSLADCMEQSGEVRMEDDNNDMDFWYNLFIRAGESSELAEF